MGTFTLFLPHGSINISLLYLHSSDCLLCCMPAVFWVHNWAITHYNRVVKVLSQYLMAVEGNQCYCGSKLCVCSSVSENEIFRNLGLCAFPPKQTNQALCNSYSEDFSEVKHIHKHTIAQIEVLSWCIRGRMAADSGLLHLSSFMLETLQTRATVSVCLAMKFKKFDLKWWSALLTDKTAEVMKHLLTGVISVHA